MRNWQDDSNKLDKDAYASLSLLEELPMYGLKKEKLIGRTIKEAYLDEEFHQGMIIEFTDGTLLKVSGHSNHSDEETYLSFRGSDDEYNNDYN